MTEETRDMRMMANILVEAERRLLKTKSAQPLQVPKIVKEGAPAVWKDEVWNIYFPISTSLKEIWWRKRVLRVPLEDQHPFSVGLGLLLDNAGSTEGSYTLSSIRTLHPHRCTLPHIDTYGGCLRVVGAPKTLVTLEDYWALHQILTRHCEGMQLDSLYTSPDRWPEGLVKSLPEEVMDWLGSDDEDDDGVRRKRMLEIFPNNSSETFEVDEEPVEHCDCPDCRGDRGELVEAEESAVEIPPPESGDVWEVEGAR